MSYGACMMVGLGMIGMSVVRADSPLAGEMKAIDGTPVDLASYKGKVVLIVNVASQCGATPQYAGLQKLYDSHKDAGLVILGFPANDFGAQEPGPDAQMLGIPRRQRLRVLGPKEKTADSRHTHSYLLYMG